MPIEIETVAPIRGKARQRRSIPENCRPVGKTMKSVGGDA
jgi:hypothetical protein